MSIAATDELLEAISELRGLFSDWRMGQLIANLVTAAGGTDAGAILGHRRRTIADGRSAVDRPQSRTAG